LFRYGNYAYFKKLLRKRQQLIHRFDLDTNLSFFIMYVMRIKRKLKGILYRLGVKKTLPHGMGHQFRQNWAFNKNPREFKT